MKRQHNEKSPAVQRAAGTSQNDVALGKARKSEIFFGGSAADKLALGHFVVVLSAMKASELADYSVGTVWHVQDRGQKIHLVDLVRGRLEYPELVAAAIALWRKWSIPGGQSYLIVEDKGSGSSLIQSPNGEVSGMLAVMDHDELVNRRVKQIARDHGVTVDQVNAPLDRHPLEVDRDKFLRRRLALYLIELDQFYQAFRAKALEDRDVGAGALLLEIAERSEVLLGITAPASHAVQIIQHEPAAAQTSTEKIRAVLELPQAEMRLFRSRTATRDAWGGPRP